MVDEQNKGTAQKIVVQHDTFTIAGDMITVDFFPGDFEADPDIIHTFLPGRVATLSETGRWTGITCKPEEWQDFIGFAEYAVRQSAATEPAGVTETLRLIGLWKQAYEIFRRAVTKGPFKSPEQIGALVA